MNSAVKSIVPELNNAVIFRTDTESNHGFPDPINCPENLSRKSIALYYYIKEKGIFSNHYKKEESFFMQFGKKRPKH